MNKTQLALKFAKRLRLQLKAAEMADVIAKNRAETGSVSVCHSHDYCDANMVMDYAFRKTFGVEVDLDNDDHLAAWNDAWTLAKTCEFDVARITAKGEQA